MGRGVLVDARWRAERRSAGRQRPPRLPSRSPAVSFSLPKTDVEDEVGLAEGHLAELLLLSKRFRSSPWRPTEHNQGSKHSESQRLAAPNGEFNPSRTFDKRRGTDRPAAAR